MVTKPAPIEVNAPRFKLVFEYDKVMGKLNSAGFLAKGAERTRFYELFARRISRIEENVQNEKTILTEWESALKIVYKRVSIEDGLNTDDTFIPVMKAIVSDNDALEEIKRWRNRQRIC
jgi:hypothetical protein